VRTYLRKLDNGQWLDPRAEIADDHRVEIGLFEFRKGTGCPSIFLAETDQQIVTAIAGVCWLGVRGRSSKIKGRRRYVKLTDQQIEAAGLSAAPSASDVGWPALDDCHFELRDDRGECPEPCLRRLVQLLLNGNVECESVSAKQLNECIRSNVQDLTADD
jgi:hypothetical protein